ncbi:MAG: hypothetical protein GH155_00745 [Spirochaeta sp.]|nr:hypothetical protein [Spirochaeta sp.]
MKQIAVVQFYFYPDISAVSQLLGDLLCTLAEDEEYNITVYCATSDYAKMRDQRDNRFDNLNIVRIKTTNIGRKSFLSRIIDYTGFYISAFTRLFLGRKWHAVISMSSPPLIAFPVSIALLFRKIPFIYYIEDLFPEILFDMSYLKHPWLIRKLQALNKVVMRRANSIITIEEDMSRKVITNYPKARDKTVEIPNWSRGVEYLPASESKEFTILYSGNMGLAHDFSMLEPLIEELLPLKNICYQFIGGGTRVEEIRNIFTKSGETRIEFRGYTSRHIHGATLAQADLFIISQTKETVGDLLPSKLYSYLAAGRPMLFLGPRYSEIGRIITDNDFGIVVEHREDVSTARRYIEFLKKDHLRARLINERIDRYSKLHFGLKKSVEYFRHTIEENSRKAG